jgi:hypothetical protein
VSGFFVRASTSDSVNAQKLSYIRGAGGDTEVTFGSHLMPASLGSISPDCRIGTANCVQVVVAGVRLSRVFAYADASPWGAASVACPRDRSIASNNKLFTIFVVPTQGPGCDSANGVYDVVVVSGGNSGTVGATESMARVVTTAQGMKFYAGMPIPAKRTDLPYLPDLSYQNTFSQFINRYLRYHAKTNDVPGLAGFYLSTEMPLSSASIFGAALAVYRIQNGSMRVFMPGRSAIVSPYIDARSAAAGRITPAEAQVAVRNIALTASGVPLSIAVQDGMGTGKGGAFFGNEASASVDQPAAAIVGAGSWGSRYLAPNRDYFVAAAQGVAGTGAALWANMEGMAPATGHRRQRLRCNTPRADDKGATRPAAAADGKRAEKDHFVHVGHVLHVCGYGCPSGGAGAGGKSDSGDNGHRIQPRHRRDHSHRLQPQRSER